MQCSIYASANSLERHLLLECFGVWPKVPNQDGGSVIFLLPPPLSLSAHHPQGDQRRTRCTATQTTPTWRQNTVPSTSKFSVIPPSIHELECSPPFRSLTAHSTANCYICCWSGALPDDVTRYCDGEDDPMCSASLQHEGFDFAHTNSETDYNKIGRLKLGALFCPSVISFCSFLRCTLFDFNVA